jgi:polyhydroxyalkanoate synthase
VRFVLGGSGHIAGIVNPPAANKYWFWTNASLKGTADEWLSMAQKQEGSWWNDWAKWIGEFGGEFVPARTPGDGELSVIEDAPGSYAKLRLDQQTDPRKDPSPAIEPPSAAGGKKSTPIRTIRKQPLS